jgi:hypothetical protein
MFGTSIVFYTCHRHIILGDKSSHRVTTPEQERSIKVHDEGQLKSQYDDNH